VQRVRCRAAEASIRPTRSAALVRSTALSRLNNVPAEWPRALRARRLAPSALASRSTASVRFTPSRAASLSPRRAPLLAGASSAHTPAPAGPLLHRATARHRGYSCRVGMAAHHSVGAAEQRIAPIADGVKASTTQPP